MRLAIALFGLSGLSSAQALCVGNAADLKSAFIFGQLQSVPYKILLRQGTYIMDDSIDVGFSAPTTIEGGYIGANCADRVVDAANTEIIIGTGHDVVMQQKVATPYARLTLDGFTLGGTDGEVRLFAGDLGTFSDDPGRLTLSRMVLRQIGDSVALKAHAGSITLENTLFEHIGSQSECAVSVYSWSGGEVNINHMTADLSAGKKFCLGDGNDADTAFSIYNSILWNSEGGPPSFLGDLQPETPVALVNTLFSNQLGLGDVTIVNQINADPRWIDPVNGDYRLKSIPLSPAINSGTSLIFGGEPATDIEGNPRIVGSLPDRGAYESPYSDQSVLTVTNTQDSGVGSLRQAMLDANTSPTIAKQIRFDIRNAASTPICPAVIALNSSLPPVESTMAIDGYTQAPLQSSANTDAEKFNANLCLMVKPASSSLPLGFHVPTQAGMGASLTLRGVGLGGFVQPVKLLGGSGHLIAGNQFGGTANGVNLPGAALNAISIGVNANGSLIIGGNSLADRNVIGGAVLAGISIQSGVQSTIAQCQIVNNLIGLGPNGTSELSNSIGVNVDGRGCGIVRNRIAGNDIANIRLNGGSEQNVVQQNKIGFTTQDAPFLNTAVGVLVSGSSGNIIGADGTGGLYSANTIRFMVEGGVVIEGDAAGNSVNANLIYDNGASGNSLDIDLRTAGAGAGQATPNDAGDADTGPNYMQNFPVAKRLVYTAGGSIDRPAVVSGVLDTLPGVHRIDAYFSSKATAGSRRGHAEIFLGNSTVNVVSGRQPFSASIEVPNQLPGGVISFTATDSVGNTSEVGTAMNTDTIFVDGND